MGQALGVLVRRGSDDNIANRAIYDLVTVFHPGSGLFFEVTMSDGVARYPATTFFAGYDCDVNLTAEKPAVPAPEAEKKNT